MTSWLSETFQVFQSTFGVSGISSVTFQMFDFGGHLLPPVDFKYPPSPDGFLVFRIEISNCQSRRWW